MALRQDTFQVLNISKVSYHRGAHLESHLKVNYQLTCREDEEATMLFLYILSSTTA